MSRPTTLLHLLLGLRPAIVTSASAIASSSYSTATTYGYCWTSPTKPLFRLAQCYATNLYSSSTLENRINTYSTMSQSQSPQNSAEPSSTTTQTQSSSSEEEKKPMLALPSTESSDTHQLDVNGDGVKLDHLGPLIVNADGTLARISNWAQMTEIERRNTLRVLGKRNKARMEALKAKQAEEEGKAQGDDGK
ncbi:hypothetical protein BJX63DRAFT_430427 [Aspergillus granulosus]|uniref:Uncharacterized protein n=1 Tax=Aspergillus granulosus TaxID=176169 RepID=A0ABR4HL70_9EURO